MILSNLSIDNSDIKLESIPPVTETSQFTTQPFVSTDVSADATMPNITHPDIALQNDLIKFFTSIATC